MRWEFLPEYFPALLRGAETTLILSMLSLLGAGALGLVVAIARVLTGEWMNRALGLWVDAFRMTPLLVQVFGWYLGSTALGLPVDPFTAAVVAVSVNYAAFVSEVVRGAVLAVPRGQRDAALSIGLSSSYSVFAIEMPQALPAIVPALIGLFISLVKDTSLAYVVGVLELTRTGAFIANQEFRPLESYLAVAFIYFLMCFPLSRFGQYMDRRMRHTGVAQERVFV